MWHLPHIFSGSSGSKTSRVANFEAALLSRGNVRNSNTSRRFLPAINLCLSYYYLFFQGGWGWIVVAVACLINLILTGYYQNK